ncbi:MAG: hypothetical protein GMKNLPBB_02354 [Myxococcota bacterium]|nr:hypothetical protein [Myxococcota bacterium]
MKFAAATDHKASDRLDYYRRVSKLCAGRNISLADLFNQFADAFPFRLGESLADARIPYSLADKYEELGQRVVTQLVLLLGRRNGAPDSLEQKYPWAFRTKLKPATMELRYFTGESAEAHAARRILAGDPHVDAAILDCWLGPEGQGKAFLTEVKKLYAHVANQMVTTQDGAPYLYLAHISMVKLMAQHKEANSRVPIKGLSYEKVERTLGYCLQTLLEAAAIDITTTLTARRAPLDINQTEAELFAVTTPPTLVAIRRKIVQLDLNPYGISEEAVESLEKLLRELKINPREVDKAIGAAASGIQGRKKEFSGFIRDAHVAGFRDCALPFLSFNDFQWDFNRKLSDLLKESDLIAGLLLEGKDFGKFHEFVKSEREKAEGKIFEAQRGVLLSELEDFLESYSRGLFKVRKGPNEDELIERHVQRGVLFMLDQDMTGLAVSSLEHYENRRQTVGLQAIIQEYESGRLYRIADDNLPMLKKAEEKTSGQLFIDLKGFTKRTFRAKEVVMADFLKTNFYEPIIAAAKKYAASATPGGPPNVQLNNLIGDAALFAGSVTSLIHLARDIQQIARQYEERLNQSSTLVSDDEAIKRVNQEFDARKARLERDLAELYATAGAAQAEADRFSQMPVHELGAAIKAYYQEKGRSIFAECSLMRKAAQAETDPAKAMEYQHRAEFKQAEARKLAVQYQEVDGILQDAVPAPLIQQWAATLSENANAILRDCDTRRVQFESQLRIIDDLREQEIKAIKGFGIESGLFISFGAAAEMVSMFDPLFGKVNVAIGEKINEAARGTGRAASVMDRINALLKETQNRTGNHKLTLPFRCYVGQAFSLNLPSDLQSKLASLQAAPDEALLRQFADGVRERIHADLKTALRGGGGHADMLELQTDIYNQGEAISEEGLQQFIRESVALYLHMYREIQWEKLAPEIREKFFFLRKDLKLVVSLRRDDPRLAPLVFHNAGRMVFRGFEAKTPTHVWELLRADDPFTKAMLHHHVLTWVQEVRANPSLQITSLPAKDPTLSDSGANERVNTLNRLKMGA